MMIYRKTETFQGEEPHSYLVDIDPDDAIDHNGHVRGASFEKVGLEDVTTIDLLLLLEREMEFGNLATDAFRAVWLAGFHIEQAISAEAAKQVIWSMIEDKGSTLGL